MPNIVNSQTVIVSFVNPQGTVTTVTNETNQPDESFSNDSFIHENCDETMFRPVVTVINESKLQQEREKALREENASQPVEMQTQLIVPVIDEKLMEKKKKEKTLEREKSRQTFEAETMKEFEKAQEVGLQKSAIKEVEVKREEPVVIVQKKGRKGQKYGKKLIEVEEKATQARPSQFSPPSESIVILPDNKKETSPESFKISVVELQKEEELSAKMQNMKLTELSLVAVEDTVIDINVPAPLELEEAANFSNNDASTADVKVLETFEKIESVKIEPFSKKGKKGKKYSSDFKSKKAEKSQSRVDEDFADLGSPPPLDPPPFDDYRKTDRETIMKISKHESIGDEEIEIIPHESNLTINDSPEKSVDDVEILEEHFTMRDELDAETTQKLTKNDEFYELDDDLPPLEPLETFDINFEPISYVEEEEEVEATAISKETSTEIDDQKQAMKKKLSELLKDTNMIFAMCSSLKEESKDDDEKSMSSSQIQRSTTSSQTTNTTTATFASASSNHTGEGQDSDYKSLELDMDEAIQLDAALDVEFKMPLEVKQFEEADEVSSFEATSSETDESSKKSNSVESNFKRDDDEELRPLLQTSTSSLSSPVLSSNAAEPSISNTTEANNALTLPETNQKLSSTQASSNNGNGNKRKSKKKRR